MAQHHECLDSDGDGDEDTTWTMPPTTADISQLHTVYHQEFTKYRTCDYIPRLQQEYRQQHHGNPAMMPPPVGVEGAINPQWREKICEWKYQGTNYYQYTDLGYGSCRKLKDLFPLFSFLCCLERNSLCSSTRSIRTNGHILNIPAIFLTLVFEQFRCF